MKPNERRTVRFRAAHRAQAVAGWIVSLLAALVVLFVLFYVWLVPLRVTGDSMHPALEDREVVLVDRLAKYWKIPARGDVVCFRDETTGSMLLKRIVALPGETVDMAEGRVYIDGRPLEESAYAANLELGGGMLPVTVGAGEVFVLSDNRAALFDSRSEDIGCIAYDEIFGVLRLRLLPTNRIALYH